MRILAIIGSPRRGGNSDLLADQVLLGGKLNGHSIDKIYLYDYEILPCIDCRGCKRGDLICRLDDEMWEIYPLLEAADIVIFATPIYWYGPTAKMKLLVDRLRPFIASRKLEGKRGVIVAPSEEGPGCCAPMEEMFRMSFKYLGMDYAGSVLAQAYEKGDIMERPEDLRRAYEIGSGLTANNA